ncbi:hypothetical protein GIB67_018040 [Kingdonia uniflora]|uniref:Uncharacterized protein n=1 Tax=Kingdonia uniflora TaxID=39325 RepID=A0A7J7NWF2_9MAGN|nr:hypothetical protein GIB67_018040 [Kingdonia uniflora]
MMPTDYEKGYISFAHLRTLLDHTIVNIKDPANFNAIFRAFMLLYFRGVLFGNSKSWARQELLGPIAVIENKACTIDFGSTILGHLYYCLDQASKQEVKYIGGLIQLIEYHCYEYYQISHYVLIDNRFSTQETQIPSPLLGDYPGWIMELGSPHGTTWYTILAIASTSTIDMPTGYDFFAMTEGTVVNWEDDESEAGTSQVGTSRGRGSWGRTSEGEADPPQ